MYIGVEAGRRRRLSLNYAAWAAAERLKDVGKRQRRRPTAGKRFESRRKPSKRQLV